MTKRRAPSQVKAQEIVALLQGHTQVSRGEELLSTLVPLATERTVQEALEREQTDMLRRDRYERRETAGGYCNMQRGR
jgi:hypothetical protein